MFIQAVKHGRKLLCLFLFVIYKNSALKASKLTGERERALVKLSGVRCRPFTS